MTRILLAFGLSALAFPCFAQQVNIELSTDRPGNLFAATAPVTVAVAAAGLARPDWRLTDFDQRNVAAGELALTDGKGSVALGVLPRGYYELTCSEGAATAKLSLGVVSDHSAGAPASTRLNVDAALSWLTPKENFEPLAQMLRTVGIGWVRERFTWGGNEPEKGKVNWQQQYEASADAYNRAGVRVYQMFHDSPGWTHPGDDATKNPEDLREVFSFAKRTAEHFKGRVQAWEVWNEPDVGLFWPDLGDTYAGLQKAAYLGFKAGDADLPVLMGSFVQGYYCFDDNLFESGVKDYFDIFNWHCYAPPEAYEGILGRYLELLGKYDCDDRPVWLTEAGFPLKATEPGGELSAAAEREQAEYVPKALAYTLAAGTDRHFFFVYPYFYEGGVQFGALHPDLSPRPGFIAIAAAADILGEAKYLGQYKLEGATAMAFDSAKGKALVIWSATPQTVTLEAVEPDARIADLFGASRPAQTAEGKLKLEVGPAPQYVIGIGEAVTSRLTGDVRAPGKLPANKPSPVVVRGQARVETLDKYRNCYFITDEPFKYAVEVCNLTDAAPTQGEVALELPAGWTCEPKSAKVSLEPMGRAVREFTITGAPAPPGASRRSG